MNKLSRACFFSACMLISSLGSGQTVIAYSHESKPVLFGVGRIAKALENQEPSIRVKKDEAGNADDILIRVDAATPGLQREGYEIIHKGKQLIIHAVDPAGAMYGALYVAEQIRLGETRASIGPKKSNPHFTVRALKFNLPWSSYPHRCGHGTTRGCVPRPEVLAGFSGSNGGEPFQCAFPLERAPIFLHGQAA